MKGYLNSYQDKNKKIHNYVTVTRIEEYDFISTNGPVIRIDYDRVEICNGQRYEFIPLTEEKLVEIEELLGQFKDGIIVNKHFIMDIDLSMEEDKKEIFKELILNYLLKKILDEKHF